MNFLVTVRLIDRQDTQQPEPFFLGTDAEWTSVELMLKSLYSQSEEELDVRYWDDEDFVILSSQEELDEACRLASVKGIMELYVRSQTARNCPWPESNTDPTCVDPPPKERPAKRTATEAFTSQNESAVDPSAHAIISLQVSDTVAKYVPVQEPSAAAAEDGVAENTDRVDVATAADAGASDPEHVMIPGASSGANVIAIEMPDCPIEVQEVTHSAGDHSQGTEAAEPAEMAETGEVAPKSGRDAETGFWMVPKSEKNECTNSASASSTQRDVQPKAKPVDSKESKKESRTKESHKNARPKDTQKAAKPKDTQKNVLVKERSLPLCTPLSASGQKLTKPANGTAEKSSKKKKHSQTDVLTQEAFLDYMTKYQSELKRDIVKDVTRKTVRQVVAGVSKIHTDSLRESGPESGDYIQQDNKSRWPICIHDKIICDHCDQLIVGPRFKCGNCINYDLCECCEAIYPPVHNATHVFLKLHKPCPKAGIRHGVRTLLLKRPLYQSRVTEMEADERNKEKAELDRLNEIAGRLKVKEAKVKEKLARKQEKLERRMAELTVMDDPLYRAPYGVLSAEFVCDVNLPDDSIVQPGRVLEKTWKMHNNGTLKWPSDTELAELRGNLRPRNGRLPFGDVRVPVGVVLPGETKNISVVFCTPEEPGNYESYWRLHSKINGLEFGHNVFFKVRVRHEESLIEEVLPPQPLQKETDTQHKRALETALEGLKEEESAAGKMRKASFEFPPSSQKPPSAPLITEILESSDRLQIEKKFNAGAVPATPNNTPFAVSPPSGRCISPSPKPADYPECSLVNISISECQPQLVSVVADDNAPEPKMTSGDISSCSLIPLNQSIKDAYDKLLSEQEAEGKQRKCLEVSREGQEKETASGEHEDQHRLRDEERITCYEWLKEQAAAAAAASRAEQDEEGRTSKERKPTSAEFDSFQTLPMLKLMPSAPIYDPEGQEDEGESTAAHNGSEEDFPLNLRGSEQGIKKASDADDANPEYVDLDGFVMCPCGDTAAAEPAEPGSDSGDDDLYASAHSPKMLEEEMPVVGPSPVMLSEDAEPEDLTADADQDEQRYKREMSPGSTASSVEVVSVADLEEFEKEDGEEEYRSIDTHGAWLSPRHMQPIPPVADLEREVGEGYEILPDDLSSMSDESSIDEDFCIVIPDCFDMSKPLKYGPYFTEMGSDFTEVSLARFRDEMRAVDQAAQQKKASVEAEADSSDCGREAEEKREAVEHSMAKVNQELCGGAEKLEDTTDKLMEMLQKEDTKLKQLSNTLAAFEAKLEEQDREEEEDDEEEEEEEEPEEDREEESSGDRLQEREPEAKEELENQENQQIEQEQAGADGHTQAASDEEQVDKETKEPTTDCKSGVDEAETEVKTHMADEVQAEEGTAAAAPTVVDVIDPGQHLNHLVQSTVKAATNGLQHLYQTTKDVIKTLQAETYECKESTYEYKPSNYIPPTSSWKPAENQYVPPRSDYKPPKSNFKLPKSNFQLPESKFELPESKFQLPKSTYTGPKTQIYDRGDEHAVPLARIREMGYFNDEHSLALLKKYKGDVHMVVDELCQETDNNWAERRH